MTSCTAGEIYSEVWHIRRSCWLSRLAILALADASPAQSEVRMIQGDFEFWTLNFEN